MSDERLPLIAALIFGMAYVFMTPPFAVPDEEFHFWRAAAIAMGHVVPNGGGKPDSAHIPQGLKTLVWVMQTTKDFQLAYRIPLEPMKEPLVQFPAWYTPMPFVPQALGVGIGRRFDVRPLVIFYAGRFANLFASLALIGFSLRISAGFRTVVAAVALLPTTLFEFASWSADAMTIAASLLFIALLSSEQKFATCVAGVVVGLCKPAYFLTAFVARRRVIFPVLLCVGAATLIAFAYAHRAAYQQRTDLPIAPASQLQCILAQPLRFASVIAKDALHHGWWYVEGAIAPVRLPLVVTWFALLLLLAVGITSSATANRLLALGIFIATAVGVLLSQFLVWSAICGDVIEGVQGRYFLPVLPLLLVSMRGRIRWRPSMMLVVAVACIMNVIVLSIIGVNAG